MSYSDLLWDSSDIVIRQSQFHRVLFQDFILALKNRIQIEQNYSTQLRTLSVFLDKHLNKQYKDTNYIIFALSAFKSDIVRKQTQTKTFINHLKEQVLNRSKTFIDKQIIQAKHLEKQIAIIETGYIEVRKKMEDAKFKLAQLDKERQQQFIKLQAVKLRSSISSEIKDKQMAKALFVEKQYKEYDPTYKGVMNEYNVYLEGYLYSMDDYLKTLQTHQQQRVNKITDNMKKIMVFESAMMRNFEYDVVNIISQLNNLEAGKDIKQFVQRYSKGNKKPKFENVPKLNLRSTVIYQMIIKKLEDRIQFQTTEVAKLVSQKLIQPGSANLKKVEIYRKDEQYQFMTSFINSEEPVTPNNPIVNKIKQLLEKQQNRNLMQLYLRQVCQQSSYSTDDRILNITQILVEKCLAKKDIFCLRRILSILFTQLNIKTIKNKEKSLYKHLYNMNIWQSTDFWEACLFEAIQQKLKQSKGNKGQTKQDAKARERIIILNQMADYCNMMIMLGYNYKNLRQLAGRYLKIYELGEQESKHLIKIMSESIAVFDDIWHSYEEGEKNIKNKNESSVKSEESEETK